MFNCCVSGYRSIYLHGFSWGFWRWWIEGWWKRTVVAWFLFTGAIRHVYTPVVTVGNFLIFMEEIPHCMTFTTYTTITLYPMFGMNKLPSHWGLFYKSWNKYPRIHQQGMVSKGCGLTTKRDILSMEEIRLTTAVEVCSIIYTQED